jgi:hypothetical protein
VALISTCGRRDPSACCCSSPPYTCQAALECIAFVRRSFGRVFRYDCVERLQDKMPSIPPPRTTIAPLIDLEFTLFIQNVKLFGENAAREAAESLSAGSARLNAADEDVGELDSFSVYLDGVVG